jgi:cytochrome oxidase assembly protein ShyY1
LDKGSLLLLELLLFVGVVFGLGFWQLASLRRDRRGGAEGRGAARRDR